MILYVSMLGVGAPSASKPMPRAHRHDRLLAKSMLRERCHQFAAAFVSCALRQSKTMPPVTSAG